MILKGLLAGGVTMAIAAVFPEHLVYPLLAAVLGLMTGMYAGMSMADPLAGRSRLHWFVALVVLGAGLVGLWVSPLLLAGAWLLHGLWALTQGWAGEGEGAPEGLPGFSLAFSLVLASFATYMWAVA